MKFIIENWLFVAMVAVIFWFVFVFLLDGLPDDMLSQLYKRIRNAREARRHGGLRD